MTRWAGTSILRRRGALRLSGDNGVDGCESSHDPPILPLRRSLRRGEVPFLSLSFSPSSVAIAEVYYRTLLSSLATSRGREAASNAEDKELRSRVALLRMW